ncbi:outer membrane beta-barrel family protein [Flavobacterium sp. H122]|uniref:outer membrane beta-barrel family protein n=1 Tax=Flavobacterium sp. H122 TaxID=2529860 RepID=UPI0010A9EF45|nr:outer membrane beta-barrel family protein [Flavobacterium sp. H122]
MKLKFLLLCLLAQIAGLQAQTSAPSGNVNATGSINGKVIEKKNGEPIPYATVSVKDEGKIISGGITKDNGSFTVANLPLKTLTVEVQFMGFKKYVTSFTLSNDDRNITLKNILLEEEAQQLNEVSVVKERSTIEQKIDRKVVNVGKDLIASGTTASEMLNNIPTLSVDPQTKELSLRGNTNVRVLVDGKPTNIDATQLLQQIPSSSIKQIELITNPSAKYNPEGMSGIINIILHKNANTGFNGSINTGVTFGITPKVNTALNLNYKVGKVNFYTNYGLNHGKNANHGDITSWQPDAENQQLFKFDNKSTSHLIKFGMDYYIDDKNTFSIFTNQNIVNNKGFGNTIVDFVDNSFKYIDNPLNPDPTDPDVEGTYIETTNKDTNQGFDSDSENKTQTYDASFKHEFDKKGENLEIQANFSNTKSPELSNYILATTNPQSNNDRLTVNDVNRDTDYLQLNVDYVNPISETLKLELGAESRIQNIGNTFFEEIEEQGTGYTKTTNSGFDFNRSISSAYATLGKQWNKWSGQFGLRLEYNDISGDFRNITNSTVDSEDLNENDKLEDKLFTVYPSAFLTYKPNDKDAFNFNVSRRVDRPSVGQLSPIREWTTPTVESRGNPNLQPQFTNSFEANYTRTMKLGSITFGAFYRLIYDEISRISYFDEDDVNKEQRILSFDNFKDNNSFGFELSTNLKLAKWWSVNASTDAYFKTVRGTVQNANTLEKEFAEADVVAFNARMNHTFTAAKNLRFTLFGMYRGRDLSLQFERLPMYKMDLGASYTILKGKGTITTRLNDMFNTMHFEFDGNIPYRQKGAFYWESRTLYVGFNYNFGGGKNKALQRKQRDANETQGGGGGLF